MRHWSNLFLVCVICLLPALDAWAIAQDSSARPSITSTAAVEDFDAAWSLVQDNYAYFAAKQLDWARVRDVLRPRAEQARSLAELLTVLESMVEQLYDPHAHLGANTSTSPRLVPSGTDLWAEYQDGRPVITAVRGGSAAASCGIHPGWEVVRIDGRPVGEVVERRLPFALSKADPAANDWALRAALAGSHDRPVALELQTPDAIRKFEFTPGVLAQPTTRLTLSWPTPEIAMIRVHNSLGDESLVAEWDAALEKIRAAAGLIVDLRDTPGGGNTTVARGIMSRLVREELPYQRHELPSEEVRFGVQRIWVEHVAPRGLTSFDRPVAVLVGRWTGSMGEGLAIGLHGMGRGYVIGSPMAGLCGANYSFDLPHSGISFRIPAERLTHVDGTPREKFLPDLVVPAGPPGSDPELQAAVTWLQSQGR